MELFSVLDVGSDICTPLAPPPTCSVIFMIMFAGILRQTISQAPTLILDYLAAHLSVYVPNMVMGRFGPPLSHDPKHGPIKHQIQNL
jgi:hypothetical protein